MAINTPITAIKDIQAALGHYYLIGMLGWQDIRQKYRRSALGPFWITISMGVIIAAIGFVFGQIFKAPMGEFLPFLAIGLILWNFILSSVSEGCNGFIGAEGIIKQLPIPLFVHILRLMWRNILILFHNLIIFPLVLLLVGKPLNLIALIGIIGFLVLVINLLWAVLILAVLSARYRDLPQLIASIMQVAFYLTPIVWMPALLPERAAILVLNLNPFYHLLEIVRAPLLGTMPSLLNWGVSVALAFCGWLVAILFYGRYKNRIPYWL
jgi:lipopolysaccharide transport system permease protein